MIYFLNFSELHIFRYTCLFAKVYPENFFKEVNAALIVRKIDD